MGAMRLPETKDGQINEPEAIDIIRSAIDAGVNYVDTAFGYHNGKSEGLVGKAPVSYTHLDVYKRQVNLCRIFAAESAAAVPRISAVGVDDELSACEA